MDYNLKCRKIQTAAEILDTVSQQAIDLDFTLPDYCADIEKILKCSHIVKIFTRSLSAGQLRVDGASVICVLYCDSDKNTLRCCEQSLPFSASFPVNGDIGENIIETYAKPEYLNCRALTPRRLTIHGAFSLHAKVLSKTDTDVFTCDDSTDLQVNTKSAPVCNLTEFSQDEFSVSDSVNLHSKSPAESIVRSELSANLVDCKQTGERTVIKGDLTLRLLYICDAKTGEVEQFTYVFPFSQTIAGGDSDTDIRKVSLDVMSHEVILKTEAVTSEPIITVDAKLSATLMGYKCEKAEYICDAYSTKYPVDISSDNISLLADINPVTVNTVAKAALSLGEEPLQKILDIFCEDTSADARIDNQTLHMSGKVNVCILGITENGELVSVERQADYQHDEMLSKSFMNVSDASCKVSSVSYRLSDGNNMELRLELCLKATLSDAQTLREVISVENIGEEELSSDCALILYYASKGESVWDIAKNYCAEVNTLCEDNALEGETLSENTMLLISR
ncbi:MAG: DUF3794 domain-containing protein [Ruminococcus sp.]